MDKDFNVYVTGFTDSVDFPTTPGAFQPALGAFRNRDAFVTKLNPTGTAPLVYSTYLGGSNPDAGSGIAVDSSGNAYVTGQTSSNNFPTTTDAFQTIFGGGTCGLPPNTFPCSDAFVTKLNPTGTALAYSTYLGGNDSDEGSGIAVDSTGNAYVTGFTASTNFPTTPGAFQTALGGGFDAFVAKISGPDYALSASPTTATVAAGQPATYALTVRSTDGFAGTVALSCSGAPAAANCSVSPASVTFSGPSAATATATVTTTARALLAPWPKLRLPPATFSVRGWLLWAICLLVLVLAYRTKTRRQVAGWVFAATMFVALLSVACGGAAGSSTSQGTPPGTSTLTITGTSGSLSHTTTVTLVVN